MTTLKETSGVITSPFYPRYYVNNQSCSWEIRARKGKQILLTIDMFYSSCGKHLEIQGGSVLGYDGPRWRVCGYLIANATYNRFKERIKVLFVSDGSTRCGSRFKISYSQENFSVSGK